jgi:hypothetical protein
MLTLHKLTAQICKKYSAESEYTTYSEEFQRSITLLHNNLTTVPHVTRVNVKNVVL